MFRRLACSFCGKSHRQVAKLVAGPRVYICDRCVAVVSRIMEEGPPAAEPASARRSLATRVADWLRSLRAPRNVPRIAV